MTFRWLFVAIFALALPLSASALPVLESDGIGTVPLGEDHTITLSLAGVTGPAGTKDSVSGLEFRVPTNVAGITIISGLLDAGTLVTTNPGTFRPSENDFFMSAIAFAPSSEIISDRSVATLRIRIDDPSAVLALKVGSAIADGTLGQINLGNVVIATVVPEPGTLVLLGAGLAGLSLLRRRPRRENV